MLRPGGRFAVSDVIADPDMDEQTPADMAAWTGCVAGALTEEEFRHTLVAAGFEESRSEKPIVSTSTPAPPSSAPAKRNGAADGREIQLTPETLYRRWEHSQWSP